MTDTLQDIQRALSACHSKEASFRCLVQLSKQLARIESDFKNDTHFVRGCESQVWLHGQQDDQENWHFTADSDSKMIRGLLVVILALVEGRSSEFILEHDLSAQLHQFHLSYYLTESRNNGVKAIVERIKSLV